MDGLQAHLDDVRLTWTDLVNPLDLTGMISLAVFISPAGVISPASDLLEEDAL